MLWNTPLVVLVTVGTCVVGVEGQGMGESSCDLDNPPVMTNFDPELATGRFYTVYRSHVPSYIAAQDITSTAFDRIYKNINGIPYYIVNRGRVFGDGTCVKSPTVAAGMGGSLQGAPEAQGNDIVQATAHILATDYTQTSLVYHEYTVNGVKSAEHSTIDIVLNDPSQPPDMSVIADALTAFCGPEAASLDFFTQFSVDPEGHEECMGSSP